MKKRCAIYTRKSTEEGLDQAFNSLDAQHDACAAFIESQKHEGWMPIKARYDDGGYSGGTIERPGLQGLLDDVRARRIDVVVVYKIDRLTRSLTDFARIVEIFDANEVSFVSVTQQFNTTTSMGRLTLNVLLSFAQFEREVTAERIRDKIAASKKKGMWMGGVVPLGYDARDKKLVVNAAEAETVRTLFRLYLELGTVRHLKEEADRRGIVTKRYVQDNGAERGGKPFSRGHLYRLLANPLYRGMVQHRGVLYDGEHEAIVDETTWDMVQTHLAGNAPERARSTNTKSASLLAGLVFDETSDRLSPSHAVKDGKRYRYYISHRLKREAPERGTGWRLPANELEDAVVRALGQLLDDQPKLLDTLIEVDDPRRMAAAAKDLVDVLNNGTPDQRRAGIQSIARRIDVHRDRLIIRLDRMQLSTPLGCSAAIPPGEEPHQDLTIPFASKRRGVETRIVVGGNNASAPVQDERLIETLAKAHRWLALLTDGSCLSIQDLAAAEQSHPAEISRLLPLAFLAPDITEAILAGRQPICLTQRRLKRMTDLPDDWPAQRQRLA